MDWTAGRPTCYSGFRGASAIVAWENVHTRDLYKLIVSQEKLSVAFCWIIACSCYRLKLVIFFSSMWSYYWSEGILPDWTVMLSVKIAFLTRICFSFSAICFSIVMIVCDHRLISKFLQNLHLNSSPITFELDSGILWSFPFATCTCGAIQLGWMVLGPTCWKRCVKPQVKIQLIWNGLSSDWNPGKRSLDSMRHCWWATVNM